MASKQVTDREKSAHSVMAAGEANADLVQAALADQVKPLLKKGEPLPDFAATVRLSCAALGAATQRMVKADSAHDTELGDDAPVREARDAAQAALREELIGLREMIIGAYGGPTASRLFLGSTPEDPVVLSRFAGEVADGLDKIKLPAPRIKGARLDVAETTGSLRDKRAGLDRLLKDLQRELREAQKTLDAKTAAIAAYDQVFAGVATTLSGLLRLAGKADLAAKVRPSARRPGQTAEEAGDETEPTPDK